MLSQRRRSSRLRFQRGPSKCKRKSTSTAKSRAKPALERAGGRKRQKRQTEPAVAAVQVNSFRDLVDLAKRVVDGDDETKHADYRKLGDIYPILLKIDALVGMTSTKNEIANFVVFKSQKAFGMSLELNNFVICGPPGCGKTTIAELIGEIVCALNGKSKKIVFGRRSNLISQYVGQTASKTEKLVRSALGGVLLIDEAYSLGDSGGGSSESGKGTDSFSKACIDTLNQQISENATRLTTVVVGYEKELIRDFFSVNPGLERRFTKWFRITKYSSSELATIFAKMIADKGMSLLACAKAESSRLFDKHNRLMANGAGTVVQIVNDVRIAHARRVFGLARRHKMKITAEDVASAFDSFVKSESIRMGTRVSAPPASMYC